MAAFSAPPRAFAVLLLASAICACDAAPPALPNVVLIEVESLRVDHLDHAGYARPTAQGLGALRESATLFTHARTPSSAALTSTASLLTGLSPAGHRVVGGARLSDAPRTLAESLRDAGWSTVGLSHHPGISAEAGFARGFDRFEAARGEVTQYPDAGEMLAWLREWLAGEPARPFLLYLHPMNAHPPYRVPLARSADLLGRAPSLDLPWGGELMRAARMPGRLRARQAITEHHVRSLVEQYDTSVRYTLDRVGEMLALLERTGHLENSVVVVTSNHGEELFEHQGFGNGHTLHEELLRVPLYVRLPTGRILARHDEPVSTQDVLPTLLALLGIEVPQSDGVSLLPLLRGEQATLPERDFAHVLVAPEHRARERALLRGRHKLIDATRRADGSRRRQLLYDLSLDPGEQEDLAAESGEIVTALQAELARRLGAAN